jgi:hypothetical protein
VYRIVNLKGGAAQEEWERDYFKSGVRPVSCKKISVFVSKENQEGRKESK